MFQGNIAARSAEIGSHKTTIQMCACVCTRTRSIFFKSVVVWLLVPRGDYVGGAWVEHDFFLIYWWCSSAMWAFRVHMIPLLLSVSLFLAVNYKQIENEKHLLYFNWQITYSTMYTGGAWDGTTTPLISIIVSSD